MQVSAAGRKMHNRKLRGLVKGCGCGPYPGVWTLQWRDTTARVRLSVVKTFECEVHNFFFFRRYFIFCFWNIYVAPLLWGKEEDNDDYDLYQYIKVDFAVILKLDIKMQIPNIWEIVISFFLIMFSTLLNNFIVILFIFFTMGSKLVWQEIFLHVRRLICLKKKIFGGSKIWWDRMTWFNALKNFWKPLGKIKILRFYCFN